MQGQWMTKLHDTSPLHSQVILFAAGHDGFSDLHRIECGTFSQIIAHTPE
jgi:hypothetical protein